MWTFLCLFGDKYLLCWVLCSTENSVIFCSSNRFCSVFCRLTFVKLQLNHIIHFKVIIIYFSNSILTSGILAISDSLVWMMHHFYGLKFILRKIKSLKMHEFYYCSWLTNHKAIVYCTMMVVQCYCCIASHKLIYDSWSFADLSC